MEAVKRAPCPEAAAVTTWCQGMLVQHEMYIREHFDDLPEVRDWKWSEQ
jgi:xylulose-5-phosphate/fructose-6-phosphate phosphoketolase